MEKNDLNSISGIPPYCVTAEDESGHRLLERYLSRRREDLTRLEAALARDDYDLIRRIGHNLHGSGAAYDLVRISILGEQIERAAERRARPGLAGAIAQLEQFLDSITVVGPS